MRPDRVPCRPHAFVSLTCCAVLAGRRPVPVAPAITLDGTTLTGTVLIGTAVIGAILPDSMLAGTAFTAQHSTAQAILDGAALTVLAALHTVAAGQCAPLLYMS